MAGSSSSDRSCGCDTGFADDSMDGNCTVCDSGYANYPSCTLFELSGTIPGDMATDADPSGEVELTFSTAVDTATLVGQTTAGACSGSVQVSQDGFMTCLALSSAGPSMSQGDTVAAFQPAPALMPGQSYELRVTTSVQASDATPLAATVSQTFATAVSAGACTGGAVAISQVYPGGGNSSAVYNQDFVELHNNSASDVDLSTWSIQYSPATSSSWSSNTVALSGTLSAGGYYLVALGGAGSNGIALPAADASGSGTNLARSGGKLALVNSTTALSAVSCPSDSSIVDFVGWGGADCQNGSSTASAPSNNAQAMVRGGLGCTDDGENGTDFSTAAPEPANSASASKVCLCTANNGSGLAGEADFCNLQFPSSLAANTGNSVGNVFGQIYETNVVSTPTMGGSGIRAELGYGSFDVNPVTEAGWTWVAASFNVNAMNNDEFVGTFNAPSSTGTYGYTFRFSFDDGKSWTYCDTDGAGSNTGLAFDLSAVGTMTVAP